MNDTQDERKRRYLLLLSICVNLGILGLFKYYGFFVSNLISLLSHFGVNMRLGLAELIIPIGISFYTFKTLSYTFDVYRGQLKPVSSFTDYALFVIFFPQIIAGPIMRAKDLLPQICAPRKTSLENFRSGCFYALCGLFQKIFIADNLAGIVNSLLPSQGSLSGYKVLIAVYAFAFQIYYDFAGYSNIAIGLGKCMGFETSINFDRPYLATNPEDFWKRWHISLSTWLRDYVYTPIAVSRRHWGDWGIVSALMATFFICGLWHGAAWTFVIWGIYQGLLLSVYYLSRPFFNRFVEPGNVYLNKLWLAFRVIIFFHLTCLGWLFFRAASLAQAFSMLNSLFFDFRISSGVDLKAFSSTILYILCYLVLTASLQLYGRKKAV